MSSLPELFHYRRNNCMYFTYVQDSLRFVCELLDKTCFISNEMCFANIVYSTTVITQVTSPLFEQRNERIRTLRTHATYDKLSV